MAYHIDAKAATKKNNSQTTASASTKKKSSAPAEKAPSSGKRKVSTKPKSTPAKSGTTWKSNSGNKKAEDKPQNDSLTLMINQGVLDWIPASMNPGGLRINSVKPNKSTGTTSVSLNENFTYLPVTNDLIKDLKKRISVLLPDSLSDYDIKLNVGDKSLAYYITTVDKLPASARKNTPFVVVADPLVKATNGMDGDIVAMWASHGRYFKPGSGQWYWQRPQLFQVTEDTHTMGYIYPYVVPMIENAGGYVMLPRERDTNRHEVIVDNDTNEGGEIYSQPYYKEMNGSKKWEEGEYEGFIYDLPDFRDTENPFENGTYRQVATIKSGKPSVAAWYADIPEDGEYAIYVSYKTLPNSTQDAHYTVNYSGGSAEFIVNQQMGGGTWIYLGTFPLEEGYSDEEPVVTLTNLSAKGGEIVTADALKIGGGMGNIARSDSRSDIYLTPSTPEETDVNLLSGLNEDDMDDVEALEEFAASVESAKNASKNGYNPRFTTSGMPRFLEGARYWLHWAGMPEDVYSPYHGKDDYKDDYTSRGIWVNYLAGGSRVLPNKPGLKIPIDVSMALHSDAGKRADDSIVGTLGIYYTNNGDTYADGTPRSSSRTLTDMLMRQITTDIRQTWEPNWTRRSMWDKSYLEARVPEVPSSLIEFMSHQNFGDMRYAIDPAFRFTVSRSIYKAIGRFIAERKDRKFVVQPLPVCDFSIQKEKKGVYKLSWKPQMDPLEPTAKPEGYVVMERSGDELGFHKLVTTTSTSISVKVNDDDIHSYKIIAINSGGASFPSEILALKEGNGDPVLIVNGFTRISAPGSFANKSEAGFNTSDDFGVPYIKDFSFIGNQTEFRRSAGDGFGKSNADYVTTVIAGNTFDFPYIHGLSIAATGKGFVSSSLGAVESGQVKLSNYKTVDLILGKQKSTIMGAGSSGVRFRTFSEDLQDILENYLNKGGNLIVSGSYVASDLLRTDAPEGSAEFAREVLGIDYGGGMKSMTGALSIDKNGGASFLSKKLNYNNTLNERMYIVEKPDDIIPVYDNAKVFLRFSDTNQPAGIFTKNSVGKTVVMSVPFETIDPSQRNQLMKDMLNLLDK